MQLIRTSVILTPVLILLLFGSILVGIDRLGFRDVSHFYTPLYDYVSWRRSAQWLPLWNPLDQAGMPLAGETSTAVFYPFRYVLFALPIPTEVAMGWYVVLHLILASLTAHTAARWSGTGWLAASFAGVIYPLSGAVLFLHTNPPFLVGAAWMPLVLGAMLARGSIPPVPRVVIAAVAMAMMILGGDPQSALHAMIIIAVVWIARLLMRRERHVSGYAVIAVPLMAAGLAAPQLAASISWSSQSDRVRGKQTERWIDPPLVGGRRHEAFQYSLAPWHTLELFTPNAFGSLLPINRRISRLIPGDGRTWTPSIYLGTIAITVLLCRLRGWRRDGIDAWLALAVLSLWLAMGQFGVVWLIQAFTGTLPHVDSAIGGPYWWLYQFVPGYDSFRYPAKWLTVFSLAAAMITSQSIERGITRHALNHIAVWLAAALTIALATVLPLRWNPTMVINAADGIPRDEFWGPLDIDAALAQIARSLLHSAFALTAIWLVVRFRDVRRWSLHRMNACLLGILLIDLGLSGFSMIARVPREQERTLVASFPSSLEAEDLRWMRTQSGGGWPKRWKETRDQKRLVDVEASVRAAWFGRWHLASRQAVLNNMVSIRSHEMAIFWKAASQATSGMSPAEREDFWRSIRSWLAIDGVVHATNKSISVAIDDRTATLIDCVRIATIDRNHSPALSQLRAHSRWTYDSSSPLTTQAFSQRLFVIARSRGSAIPVVQAEEAEAGGGPQEGESRPTILVTNMEAEQVEYEIHVTMPTLLTRPVFQDGHWVSQCARAGSTVWQPLPVHRVDHLGQGVVLPTGQWKLRFQYRPSWLAGSLVIAALCWVSLIVRALLKLVRRVRRQRERA